MKDQRGAESQTSDVFQTLKELQSLRKSSIKMQIKMNNGCQALVARFFGYQTTMDEKSRKKVWAAAGKVIKAVEKNKPAPFPEDFRANPDDVIAFIKQTQQARIGYDVYRAGIESRMETLAKTLPYYSWFASKKGFTAMGLARIVGESGDLLGYSNPGKLWKRFALHVHKGQAPSAYTNPKWRNHTPDDQEWVEISNVRHRRAEIFSIVDVGAIQCGNPEYRALYDERKAYEKEKNPEITDDHAHKRAHRYVAKRLLRELWVEARKSQDYCEHQGIPARSSEAAS